MGQDYDEKKYIIECINELLKNKAVESTSKCKTIIFFCRTLILAF